MRGTSIATPQSIARLDLYDPWSKASPQTIDPIHLRKSRWLFYALCCYIVAQAYTIPILPIGPWALWPRLADVVAWAMIGLFILSYRHLIKPSATVRHIFVTLLLFFGMCLWSYIVYMTFVVTDNANGIRVGAFQCYTLALFSSLFWVVAHIPLTPARMRVLQRLVFGVFVFVCLSIIVTYFEIIPVTRLAPHLPRDPDVAGPWFRYNLEVFDDEFRGWGTIGYNRHYVASQVLILLGVQLYFTPKLGPFREFMILALALSASFFTTSRAVFAATLLFVGLRFWMRPLLLIVSAYLGLLLLLLFLLLPADLTMHLIDARQIRAVLERQSTLTAASEGSNLSGRAEIWAQRIDFLDAEPTRWVVGTGFGAATDSGNHAHNLILQLILEMGLIGVVFFTLLFGSIIYFLIVLEPGGHAILLMTLAALFASSTYEQFYPLASMGHFLGFYFVIIAIVFRTPIHVSQSLITRARRITASNAGMATSSGGMQPCPTRRVSAP